MENLHEVLLIESDPAITRVITQTLNQKRFNIAIFNTVQLALENLRVSAPNIVVLDLSVSDCHQVKGIHSILASVPNLPIIVLTGEEDDLTAEALKAGAKDYLFKNHFLAGVLEMRILRALGHSRESIEEELDRCKKSIAYLDGHIDETSQG